jgi:hypothetical protein
MTKKCGLDPQTHAQADQLFARYAVAVRDAVTEYRHLRKKGHCHECALYHISIQAAYIDTDNFGVAFAVAVAALANGDLFAAEDIGVSDGA